jgi:hypothetical protein
MFVTRLQARDILSYSSLDLSMGAGLTTVTGPNSAGKSNLGRCIEVVLTALGRYSHALEHEELADLEALGRNGARAFRVGLSIVLDQPWERDLIANYLRSVLAHGRLPNDAGNGLRPYQIDQLMRGCLDPVSIEPLHAGTLWIFHDKASRTEWSGSWEFEHDGQQWHAAMFGANAGQLRPGPAHADSTDVARSVPTLLEAVLTSTAIKSPPPEAPAPGESGDVPETADSEARAEGAFSDELPPVVAASDLPGDPVVGEPGAAQTAAGPEAQAESEVSFDFTAALPLGGTAVSITIQPAQDGSSPQAESLRQLGAALEVGDVERNTVDLTRVMWAVLRRGIVLTENRRVRFTRRFPVSSLREPVEVADGANVSALLHVLKNGDADQRRRFARIQELFHQMTDDLVDVRSEPTGPNAQGDPVLAIDPVILREKADRRVVDSGAGRQEALVLACLLVGEPGRCLVLDEPAANIEVVGQRRLLGALQRAGQCLLITHSPDLVPVIAKGDLANLVRLAPGTDGTRVFRAPALTENDESKWVNRLEYADTRALLFARTVVLCEGDTDRGALNRWWAQLDDPQLPPLAATGLHLVDVGSDSRYGVYIEFLEAFGVQWAIVADGPALAPGSDLQKQLRNQALLPDDAPDKDAEFEPWCEYWRRAGVFTLADTFGNDGSKAGEIEAFLRRVDADLYAQAERLLRKSKPRIGAYFAANCPPPAEVRQLYQDIIDHFARGEVAPPAGQADGRDGL